MATTTNDGSGQNNSGSWTGTTNLYDGDAGTFASTPNSTATHWIEATGYDFASVVPSDASLTSVVVEPISAMSTSACMLFFLTPVAFFD